MTSTSPTSTTRRPRNGYWRTRRCALIDHYVGDIIRETGKLCFAGGVALNVKLNQRLLAWPHLKELFVQPAAGDAGTSVGAASYVAMSLGEPVRKMEHVYLGPSFSTDECIAACRQHPQQPELGAARRRARARGADHRRRAAARLVSGTDGVRTAGARQPQHPRRPEPRGHGGAHQCADQVPRALAALLPERARYRRARYRPIRSSGAVHDDRLRRRRALEGTHSGGRAQGRHAHACRWSAKRATRASTG